MRPEILNYLNKSISALPGIGPKIETLFNKLTGNKLVNLLWHLPYNIIKREMHENITDANINSIVIIKVKTERTNVTDMLPVTFAAPGNNPI